MSNKPKHVRSDFWDYAGVGLMFFLICAGFGACNMMSSDRQPGPMIKITTEGSK